MTDGLTVCHVVNSVRDTSMPGDLATTQQNHEAIEDVGILAWFDVEPFRNDDTVDIQCLNIPSGKLSINRGHYTRVKNILREYDVIHTHHPHSGFYGKLIARRLGKPIVVTDHNNHDGFTRKGRVANGLTNVFADRVAPVSESVRDSFGWWERQPVDDTKVGVINNGVDLERLERAKSLDWSIHDVVDIESNAVIVGSAGMLVEQKAPDVLIDAVDRANERSERPIALVISGAGELRDELEAQIAASDHSDQLHLLGFLDEREQVYKMMDEIDIYAMPSRWEGFCVAALEAMAIGNACVFSNIPEFKRPFGTAARFHERDDPDDLADELVGLASDSDLRADFVGKARQLVSEKYTIERTAEQYVDCYCEIT